MAEFLTFVVAGLAGGSSYALLALGIVLVARSSRVLNFAQGEVGAFATFVVASLVVGHGWPWLAGIGVGVVVGGATSGVAGALLMRNPRAGRVPPLIGTVALLSLLVVVEARWFGGNRVFPSPLQGDGVEVAGVVLTPTRLVVLGAVAVTGAALYGLVEHTRFGLALRAGANDRDAATIVGLSPVRVEGTAWLIAGVLGALAGVFLGWTNQTIAPAFLSIALTRGFTAAILAGMASMPGAAAGGLLVGVAESLTRRYWGSTPGSSELVVFAILFAALLVRPQGVFGRRRARTGADDVDSLVRLRPLLRVPRDAVGPVARLRAALTVVGVAVGAVLVAAPFTGNDAFRLASIPIFGLLALSLNSLLATTGQLSLGHVGLFGLGAFMTAVAATRWGFPVAGAVAVGVASAAGAALALGVAALRVRGLYLSVLTLAFASFLERFVFPRPFFSQGGAGIFVARPELGPFDFADDRTFLAACLLVLGLAVLADRALLTTPAGRSFVAVRDNEAAAAAAGIAPAPARVAAFAFSGALAGLAGALFAYRQGIVVASAFPITLAFGLLVWLVLGGTGSRVAVVTATGVFIWSTNLGGGSDRSDWLVLGGAAAVVALIAQFPDGVAGAVGRLRHHGKPREAPAPTRGAPPPAHLRRAPPRLAVRTPSGRLVAPVLLAARDLRVSFGAVLALDDVSVEVEPRQIVAVVGPNGAGKTTLFQCLSGFLVPDRGDVWLTGRRVTRTSAAVRARRGMARTFQQGGIWPSETVLANLLIAQHGVARQDSVVGLCALSPEARTTQRRARAIAASVLDIIGLQREAFTRVADLPYGDRKLLELGCALITRPRVLLLDEPAAGMDDGETARTGEVITAVRAELGVAVVVIEHHVPFVRAIADRLVVLDFGQVIAQGRPDEVADDPRVVKAYLGPATALGIAQGPR